MSQGNVSKERQCSPWLARTAPGIHFAIRSARQLLGVKADVAARSIVILTLSSELVVRLLRARRF